MKGFLIRSRGVIIAFIAGSLFTYLDCYSITKNGATMMLDGIVANVEKELDIEVEWYD